MTKGLQEIFNDLLAEQARSVDEIPPVAEWNPPLSGDMDLIIRRNGNWIHNGGLIKRPELVRLFAKVLKREGNEHFLVTPVEKWRIRVEDTPLFVTTMHSELREGQRALIFESSTGDTVVASQTHPIRVEEDPQSGEPSPYLRVRANLEGRMSRAVFYQLVDLAQAQEYDGQTWLGVESMGSFFKLGRL